MRYDAAKYHTQGVSRAELTLTHMDGNFYPGLSNYRYSRIDNPTFSRHIYFAAIDPDDEPLIFGDGVDRGRKVIGFSVLSNAFNERLENDLRYRHVYKDSGKFVESVTRNVSTIKVTPDFTLKSLLYYQHLPRTHANVDPIIYAKTMYSLTDYFSDDESYAKNVSIIDDKDPSVGAFGLGGKYDFSESVSFEGIYEQTNDPLDFPRGLFSDTYVSNELRDGVLWDKVVPFLYDQQFYDLRQ